MVQGKIDAENQRNSSLAVHPVGEKLQSEAQGNTAFKITAAARLGNRQEKTKEP